jgi:hypothetical protein
MTNSKQRGREQKGMITFNHLKMFQEIGKAINGEIFDDILAEKNGDIRFDLKVCNKTVKGE